MLIRSLILLLVVGGVAPAALAQTPEARPFGDRPSFEIALPQFSDDTVTELIATLDALLPDHTRTRRLDPAAAPLQTFIARLQTGHLSPGQESLVMTHLDWLARAYEDGESAVGSARHAVSRLMVGKVAPDIDGVDLDGLPLRLSDHRGRVVVLKFTGDWCGICRSEYPYDRFLLELYEHWPLTILSVDSSTDVDAARAVKAAEGLEYRTWWDGPRAGQDGPIATAWNVSAWPSVYVLDGDGVIRFVNVRRENLMRVVRQLLDEQVRARKPAR